MHANAPRPDDAAPHANTPPPALAPEQAAALGDQQDARLARLEETRALWNAKATFWDERMGEGNLFHTRLIHPAVTQLLDVQPGERMLDIACGNGQMARWLAQQGAEVLATDFSEVFLARAEARAAAAAAAEGATWADRITYRLVDATSPSDLAALGEGYDAALCLMGLMDMPEIEPLAQALPRLLRPGGRFVLAVQHPAFNSAYVHIQAEGRSDGSGSSWVAIHGYSEPHTGLGAGMPDEPNPHWYFHRPIGALLAPFFAAGLVLDGFEEPVFSAPVGDNPVSWTHLRGIPPVLALRLRRPA